MKKRLANSVGSLRAVSFVSTLFAQVLGLVCRAWSAGLKELMNITFISYAFLNAHHQTRRTPRKFMSYLATLYWTLCFTARVLIHPFVSAMFAHLSIFFMNYHEILHRHWLLSYYKTFVSVEQPSTLWPLKCQAKLLQTSLLKLFFRQKKVWHSRLKADHSHAITSPICSGELFKMPTAVVC